MLFVFITADIGGPCDDATYCHTSGAICKDEICQCRQGIVDKRVDRCDMS